MSGTERVPGVTELDHTADVGIEVRAASLAELFDRAGHGMLALVREPDGTALDRVRREVEGGERTLEIEAADAAELLVRWLRELLHLYDSEAAEYVEARFQTLEETRLVARVRTGAPRGRQIREVKGVTYHDLDVRHDAGVWRARVIFDV